MEWMDCVLWNKTEHCTFQYMQTQILLPVFPGTEHFEHFLPEIRYFVVFHEWRLSALPKKPAYTACSQFSIRNKETFIGHDSRWLTLLGYHYALS